MRFLNKKREKAERQRIDIEMEYRSRYPDFYYSFQQSPHQFTVVKPWLDIGYPPQDHLGSECPGDITLYQWMTQSALKILLNGIEVHLEPSPLVSARDVFSCNPNRDGQINPSEPTIIDRALGYFDSGGSFVLGELQQMQMDGLLEQYKVLYETPEAQSRFFDEINGRYRQFYNGIGVSNEIIERFFTLNFIRMTTVGELLGNVLTINEYQRIVVTVVDK